MANAAHEVNNAKYAKLAYFYRENTAIGGTNEQGKLIARRMSKW